MAAPFESLNRLLLHFIPPKKYWYPHCEINTFIQSCFSLDHHIQIYVFMYIYVFSKNVANSEMLQLFTNPTFHQKLQNLIHFSQIILRCSSLGSNILPLAPAASDSDNSLASDKMIIIPSFFSSDILITIDDWNRNQQCVKIRLKSDTRAC